MAVLYETIYRIIERQGEVDYIPNEMDRCKLKEYILDDTNISLMATAIYNYSYYYEYDQDIAEICKAIIINKLEPDLSVACFEAMADHWCRGIETVELMREYLEPEFWEDYYDTIIFIVRYCIKSEDKTIQNILKSELTELKKWSIENKEEILEILFDEDIDSYGKSTIVLASKM